MATKAVAWRKRDLLPFLLLGILAWALPFIPFLNRSGVLLVAYLAICATAAFFLVRFPTDDRPVAEDLEDDLDRDSADSVNSKSSGTGGMA
jgi:hypothetical protein